MLIAAAFLCTAPIAIDGDTLHCRNAGSVRLLSIDAPETAGHCRRGRVCTQGDGEASKRALAQLIAGRAVRCTATGADSYGRTLARCSADQIDLSCAMVTSGFAAERYGRLDCN